MIEPGLNVGDLVTLEWRYAPGKRLEKFAIIVGIESNVDGTPRLDPAWVELLIPDRGALPVMVPFRFERKSPHISIRLVNSLVEDNVKKEEE